MPSSRYGALLVSFSLMFICAFAHGANLPKRTLCLFDPVGNRGPVFERMLDYQNEALLWGVQLELKAYTNEQVAANDFKTDICDAMAITGTRVRPFNRFTSSLEAVGGIDNYAQLKRLIEVISSPRASRYMNQGPYEIAGIMPGGAVYAFVRDKRINSIKKAAGKRIAALDYDEASRLMVQKVGGTLVASSIATFAPRFNNGDVDIAYAPAVAYKPLELYRGLGEQGAIYRFGLAQMNLQLVLKRARFPEGFAQKSRLYLLANFDDAMMHILQAEKDIPARYWLTLNDEKEQKYKAMLRSVRIELTQQGVYDHTMMRLMFKLRCQENPAHFECSQNDER